MKRAGETYVTKQMMCHGLGFLPAGTELVVVDHDRAGWTTVALVDDLDDSFEVSSTMLTNEVL